jgi:hypothetical protein
MSTITYEDLIKKDTNGNKDKNDNYERLQNNILLNKRESYADSNKIINDLNEELLSLKRKMKFVFERDKEIEQLKMKINEYERGERDNDSKSINENIALKQINETLNTKNMEYLSQIEASLFEDKKTDTNIQKYKDEIKDIKSINDKLMKENSILKRQIKRQNKQEINHNIDKDFDDDLDTIHFDIKPKIDEKIVVDIERLKSIIDSKLKEKNTDKIDNAFKKYGIRDKKSVNREKINTLLKEIMLN